MAETIEMLIADDFESKPEAPARFDSGEIENKSRLIAEITQLQPRVFGQKQEGQAVALDDIRLERLCDRSRAGRRFLR
jgi:hypothetical protein